MPTAPIKRADAPLPPWLTGIVMPLTLMLIAGLLGWVTWSLQINTTSQKEVLSRIEGMDRRLTVLEQIASTQTQTLTQVVKAQAEELQRITVLETTIRMQQPRQRVPEWEIR